MAKIKKKVKTIKIDADKCNGCRGCEIVCSAFHANPRYSGINPARSRIQVLTDRMNNKWLPVFAGEYTAAECMGRDKYIIDGKEYEECDFCRAVMPVDETYSKNPIPAFPSSATCVKTTPMSKPMCVEWCLNEVLVYEEREEEVEEDVKRKMLRSGLQSMISKYGMDKVADTVARMSQSKKE